MTISVKSKVEHDATNIPQSIVQALHLQNGEKLSWQIIARRFYHYVG